MQNKNQKFLLTTPGHEKFPTGFFFFFYQNGIHMFTNNIYNIKTIKIKATFKKPNYTKTVP